MKAVDIPVKFEIPFADGVGEPYSHQVPKASQIGITAGKASLETGFPPVNFLPVSGGGTPPFGDDMNGIINQATAWNRWQNACGPVWYDGTFSAAIGGYPAGATVASAVTLGLLWYCLTDDNLTDPDAGGSGWVPFYIQPQARIVTASGAFTMLLTDRSIGLNRTTSVATSSGTLPSSAYVGYEVAVADLVGNFQTYPVTITRPAGQTISGFTTFTLNVNHQFAIFRYFGSNLWGVKV